MKKIYFLFTFLFFTSIAFGQQFSWVKTGVETGYDPGSKLSSNQDLVASTCNVADTTGQPGNHFNLTLSDTTGTLLWSKSIRTLNVGLSALNNVPAVAIDNNRNVILAGSYRTFLTFDNSILRAPATNGLVMYLLKFNAAGVLQWERQSIFTATQNVYSINTHTDAADNIYVTGSFTGTLKVGITTITALGQFDPFVAKYDSNGNLLWLKNPGLTNDGSIVRAEVGSNGTIFLAQVKPGTGVTSGITSSLLIKSLDTNGNSRWAKTISPAGNTSLDMALDDTGNLYLAGNYTHSIDFTNAISLTSILNYRTYLAKFDLNGNCKWAKDLATGNNYTSGPPAVCFTADKGLAITGSFTGTASFNNTLFTSAPTQNKNTFVIKTDTSGAILWTNSVPSATGGANEASGIAGDANGNLYISGNIFGNANFNGSVQNTVTTRNFIAKLTATGGSLVTGVAFIDSNLNGIQDVTEPGIAGIFISTSTNSSTNITGPDGSYSLLLPKGVYTIVASPKKYHTTSPASHHLVIFPPNREINNKNFAFKVTPNKTDVSITLTNQSAARPGFNFSYNISFKNDGTRDISDTITLHYDPANLTNVVSSIAPVYKVNGTIKWVYTNLKPNESRSILANFLVPASTPLNTVLLANAIIKPTLTDEFPTDNYDSTRVVVTGSYDPNDKQVDKPKISPTAAAAGEYLDYTIRFQNTGTDTAFTVMVSDKIGEGYQLNSFEMLAASHPYTLRLIKNSILEWHFDKILLPDSGRNEPGSHGFIRFRIKSKPGLALGDSVRNNAAIYFDFNAPVITNYAVTNVVQPANYIPAGKDLNTIKLYPNPARNYVVIETQFKQKTPVTISLVNMLGQTISKITLSADQQLLYKLPLNNLPKGVYIIQLETETGRQTQRLVIQ